jgi:hypothetical protein
LGVAHEDLLRAEPLKLDAEHVRGMAGDVGQLGNGEYRFAVQAVLVVETGSPLVGGHLA